MSETTSIFENPPPSYHSINDAPESEACPDPPLLNKFSKWDTCWILAGLWSVVLLGAFDGQYEINLFLF